MCYSYRTSIISYTLGMLSALYTKQTIGIINLILLSNAALIWKGIDENNIKLNEIGTSFGKYLLATHNIAIGLGILIVSKKYSILPLLIGIIFFLFVILYYYQNNIKVTYPYDRSCNDKNCQNNNNRLEWPYPHEWYVYSFILSLIFCIIYVNPLSSKIFLSSIFTITFLITILFFDSKKVGSVWCFSEAILSPILVIINYFLINTIQ